MTSVLPGIILLIYASSAMGLLVYGLNCYVMVAFFLIRHRGGRDAWQKELIKPVLRDCLPRVTVQLPLYNEANVAERIIRAASTIRYPQELLEIQVLDDSTDETCAIVDEVASELRASGVRIEVLRRPERIGYKGGALREGMKACKGELIAIFDSDFMPGEDFLEKMVTAMLSDRKLGFLQARWGHLNGTHSLLTRAQVLGIDGHFMIEQCARAYSDLFLNFNGTAGLWRRQAIYEAGNWQDDTLTEDMDLSYRCQLAGWKASYLPDIVVPAELPETYAAFKNQQFRWAKGSMQTAVKLLPRILASDAGVLKKLQAALHLTHYVIHPLMVVMALLALPVLLTAEVSLPFSLIVLIALGIVSAMLGPSSMYVVSQAVQGRKSLKRLLYLPVLMCVGVGIALSNTRAVLEGLWGVKTTFVRTPKSGELRKHYKAAVGLLPLLEIGLGIYCAYTILVYAKAGKYLIGPFLLIYALGFLFIGLSTFREGRR